MKRIGARQLEVPRCFEWESSRSDTRWLRSFADTPRKEVVQQRWGDTDDIMRAIVHVLDKDQLKAQVKAFAQDFKDHSVSGQYDRLYELWAFCRDNILYQVDPAGEQHIKHPLVVYEDGFCDCKGLSIYQYFVLRCLQIPAFVRFAAFESDGHIQHVYPVAILGGEEVILDAVSDRFDFEEPATNIIDRHPALFRPAAISGKGGNGRPRIIFVQ